VRRLRESKLANLLFAYELQRRLAEAGHTDTLSVACHPSYADTNLQYRGPEKMGSTLRYGLMRVANAVFAQSAGQGALPLLYAATATDVEGGAYCGPSGFMNMRGSPERQESTHHEADAARLWELSEQLTGVEYDLETSQTARPHH
jgi:NAD(P)-dependent dehydrogenase (short-subunit alcohol dehydrogenase family)